MSGLLTSTPLLVDSSAETLLCSLVDMDVRQSASQEWHDHALAITDIYATPSGRILTTSMDRTLKVQHLMTRLD